MRALCIKEPYSFLIFSGNKTVEYRTWRTSYRGDVIICTSKRPIFDCPKEWLPLDLGEKWADDDTHFTIPGGYAVGVVELLDVVPFKKEHVAPAFLDSHSPGWAWLVKPKFEIEPLPVKSKLSLFELDIPLKPIKNACYADMLLKQNGSIVTA